MDDKYKKQLEKRRLKQERRLLKRKKLLEKQKQKREKIILKKQNKTITQPIQEQKEYNNYKKQKKHKKKKKQKNVTGISKEQILKTIKIIFNIMLISIPIIIFFSIGSKIIQDINDAQLESNLTSSSEIGGLPDLTVAFNFVDFLFSSPVFIILMGIIILKIAIGTRRSLI